MGELQSIRVERFQKGDTAYPSFEQVIDIAFTMEHESALGLNHNPYHWQNDKEHLKTYVLNINGQLMWVGYQRMIGLTDYFKKNHFQEFAKRGVSIKAQSKHFRLLQA